MAGFPGRGTIRPMTQNAPPDPFAPRQEERPIILQPAPYPDSSTHKVLSGPIATITALVTAVAGALAAWQGIQSGAARDERSYEVLRAAVATQGTQMQALHEDQKQLRAWVQRLANSAETRAEKQGEAIARRIVPRGEKRREAAQQLAGADVPIATPPPPLPSVPEPSPLPPYTEIAK